MKTNKTLFGAYAALALASATGAFAQTPPPNDDFAHRAPLTGSSITFAGTLVGSTVEPAEGAGFFGFYPPPGGGSVWWTWTTPATTRVVIEILSTPSTTNAELAVYTGTAINALTFIDLNRFGDPPGRYICFLASPTNTYQFRVAGIGTQPFSLRLTSTNPPIFIFHPQDCLVSPFASAFFSAMATGPRAADPQLPSTSYQWSFNGVPIPGQTSPSLIVHSVTTNQSGSYSVVASNIGGMTQGGTATLTVIDTNPVPQIAALQPTNPSRVPLALTGEPGRWYMIESSTNFFFGPFVVRLQLTNSSEVISLSRFDPIHFIRASLDARTDGCIAQLKQMWWAEKLFAIETRRWPTDVASFGDLKPYLHLTPQGFIYVCPAGGTYAIGGALTNPPTCTLSTVGHTPIHSP